MFCHVRERHSQTRQLIVVNRCRASPVVILHCGDELLVKFDTAKVNVMAWLLLNSGVVGVAYDEGRSNSVVFVGGL